MKRSPFAPKTYAKNVHIQLGPLTVNCSLMSIISATKKNVAKKKLVGPEGQDIHQVYQDDIGNIYSPKDTQYKSLDTGKVFDKTQYKETVANITVPKNDLRFDLVDISVENKIYPSNNNPYVVAPKNDRDVLVNDLLVSVLGENAPFLALTYGVVRDMEGMFRLVSWDGKLLVQKQYSPELFKNLDKHAPPVDLAVICNVTDMLSNTVIEYNPDNFKDKHIARLTSLVGGDTVEEQEDRKSNYQDIVRYLSSFT